MKTRYSRRYRLLLISTFSLIAILIVFFNYYFFTKTDLIESYFTNSSSVVETKVILEHLEEIKKASFSFIIATLILTSTALIHLIFTSTFALEAIFKGIRKIDSGDLKSKINLATEDEFSQISDFLNEATDHLEIKQNELVVAKQGVEKEITARTHELAVEKNKLSTTLTYVMDAVIAVDRNGVIQIFNSAAERITGYKSNEAIGKYIESILTIYENSLVIPYVNYCPTTIPNESGISYTKSELLLSGKNGMQTYIDLTTARIKQDKNGDLGWIITLHDVSAEHQLEEMKIDFVSMAAHELRTPLTSIRGYLSIFMDENGEKFDETQKKFLSRIQISTAQLLSLIENLLSVSKIERGVFTVNEGQADWIDMVRQAIEGMSERASDKKISLIFQPPTTMIPKIPVDSVRIMEVLDNLISNAISYTKSGGTITIAIEEKDGNVITHITDTGEGIPPQAIPHLFKKFFRVSGKLEQGSKGNGLGLYISKSIVDMHRGSIWVKSELNRGSTFSFSLPINP